MPPAIQTVELSKYFYPKLSLRQMVLQRRWPVLHGSNSTADRITAVDRVSLDVQKGELLGLLGPNGAGKTTLVKILCTLILPDSGTATVNGFDLADEEHVKASIGWIAGDERSFYWRLTGRQNLEFFASLNGLARTKAGPRIESLSKLLDLSEFLDRRFDQYSSGMKQRLGIARGLLNKSEILFLDEPTRSLDPTSAAGLRATLFDLTSREGYTVVLVTHHLREAEELCDRVAIMHHGRISVVSDIAGLRKRVRPEKTYRFVVLDLPPQAPEVLQGVAGVVGVESEALDGRGVAVTVRLAESEDRTHLAGVIESLVSQGGRIADVDAEELPLEEIFRTYTT